MKWWGWWRRHGNGKAARAAKAEAYERFVRNMTPEYERLADSVSVPMDEFAERVARAFGRRHA